MVVYSSAAARSVCIIGPLSVSNPITTCVGSSAYSLSAACCPTSSCSDAIRPMPSAGGPATAPPCLNTAVAMGLGLVHQLRASPTGFPVTRPEPSSPREEPRRATLICAPRASSRPAIPSVGLPAGSRRAASLQRWTSTLESARGSARPADGSVADRTRFYRQLAPCGVRSRVVQRS